jgi:hypothetical protein
VQVIRSILISSLLLAGATGCQNTYKQTTTEVKPNATALKSTSRIYVAMPEDAMDKKETVATSGRRTMLALRDAFKRHTKNVVASQVPETLPDSITHARLLDCEYVAYPTILKWQDRKTEFTGVRDKLQLRVDLVSVESGEVIRSTTVEAKSKMMTDGDEAPQDLLPEPVDKFVRSLFRMTYTPTALQK